MKADELPEKYQNCDWLWNYGSIGLTKEHIRRLNNAINILESINEHTDAKYLKEIKDKLLEDAPETKIVKTNTDAIIEKGCEWLSKHAKKYYFNKEGHYLGTDELVEDFKLAMEL